MITATISIEEAIWTISAFPGLIMWARNSSTARRTLKAATLGKLHVRNGRLVWAKFTARMTSVLAGIELVFVLIGVLSMTREPNPSTSFTVRLIILIGLVGSSVALTVLAAEWMRVHDALIHGNQGRDEARDAERDAERDPIRDHDRDEVRDEPRDDLRDERRDIERDPPRDEDRDVQRDVQRDPRRDVARDADSV